MLKLRKYVIVFVVSFLFLEVTSRIIFDRPWVNGRSFDKFTGITLTPGTNGWWTREGRGFVEINSRGMRDNREYEDIPKNSTYRIAIVGDSYVEALQVNVSQTFWRLMESRLNSECNNFNYEKFEVLPFGVSGHGPAQYLLNIKHKISKLNPDLILVIFTPGNDFRNSIESLENDPFRPYLVEISESKKLYEWDLSFRGDTFRSPAILTILQITSKSHILSLSQEVILRIRAAIQSTSRATALNNNNQDKLVNLGDYIIYLPYEKLPEEWKKSRRVVEQIIFQIGNLDQPKQRIIGVIGTNGVQTHPSIKVRNEFTKELGLDNLEEPSNFLKIILQNAGMQSIDLSPELSKSATNNRIGMHGQVPNWGGHWNSKGHLEVAKILSRKVCDLINPVGQQAEKSTHLQ